MEILYDLFTDYTLRTVALGSATLGIVSGTLGTYAVLRRQSLLGDAISHAALPGIALAFLLTGMRASLILVTGAAFAGWIATLCIIGIVRKTRIKYDTALGLVLSVFFGFGLVLLTYIQRHTGAAQAGLDTFLFGQAATLLTSDITTMAALGGVSLLCVTFLWKEFKIISFDEEFGASLGMPVRYLDVALTSLIVIAIVIGLQTVGVVLMSAMLIAPAAAARQWSDRLGVVVVVAGLFGAVAGVTGAVISSSIPRMPTGPTIVLCATLLVILSFAFAGNRGLFWQWLRSRQNRNRLQLETVLCDLYVLALQHDNPFHAHHENVLLTMGSGDWGVAKSLQALEDSGWVEKDSENTWRLTEDGRERARLLAESRGISTTRSRT